MRKLACLVVIFPTVFVVGAFAFFVVSRIGFHITADRMLAWCAAKLEKGISWAD